MPASVTFRVPCAQWSRVALDTAPPDQPHHVMIMVCVRSTYLRRWAVAFGLAFGLALASLTLPVQAAEQKPAAEPAAKPRPAKPSHLTGNALPKCEAGTYVAGHICKPAPPGFYAPSGGLYPVACAEGMTSRAGSRSASECYPEGGSPPAPPTTAKKGGS